MSALTKQRRSQNLIDGLIFNFEHPAKATKVFYKGALVATEPVGGFLVPNDGTPGLRIAGLVDTGQNEKVDTTGQTDGDTVFKVQAGIWLMRNSASPAGDIITQADRGKDVFAVDDQTVSKTDGGTGRPIAGQVCMVNSSGVFVAVGFPFRSESGVAAAGSNLVTSGAVGVTTRTTRLSVTGTVAYTLADGTYLGQRRSFRCTVAASTPAGTLTPAHASGFTAISAIDAVGDQFELEWNGTAWEVVSSTGVTVS